MSNLILNGLTNYWPFWNSTYDFIGNAHASDFSGKLSYGLNKFDFKSSAVQLNSGNYLKIKAGVYFSGDFTVSCFFKFNNFVAYTGVFGFGETCGVSAYTSRDHDLCIVIYPLSGNNNYICSAVNSIQINVWYYFAFTLNNYYYNLYLNGNSVASMTGSVKPLNITRNINHFATPNSTENIDISSFKIYNRALSSSEVKNEFDNYSNSWVKI